MKFYILSCFVCLLLINELWTLVPENYGLMVWSPYLFRPNQQVSLWVWVDYACSRVDKIIFFHMLWIMIPEWRKEIAILFWLSVGYLVDYLLIYNEAFMKIGNVPISYTTFMIGVSLYVLFQNIRTNE